MERVALRTACRCLCFQLSDIICQDLYNISGKCCKSDKHNSQTNKVDLNSVRTLPGCYVKTIKLAERPTTDQLQRQHLFLSKIYLVISICLC